MAEPKMVGVLIRTTDKGTADELSRLPAVRRLDDVHVELLNDDPDFAVALRAATQMLLEARREAVICGAYPREKS